MPMVARRRDHKDSSSDSRGWDATQEADQPAATSPVTPSIDGVSSRSRKKTEDATLQAGRRTQDHGTRHDKRSSVRPTEPGARAEAGSGSWVC